MKLSEMDAWDEEQKIFLEKVRRLSTHYCLKDKVPTPCSEEEAFRKAWFEYPSDPELAPLFQPYIGAEATISSCFLPVHYNVNPAEGPPECFETLVVGGPLDDMAFKSRTWAEALAVKRTLIRCVEALAEEEGLMYDDTV